jgi:hypothetical protein
MKDMQANLYRLRIDADECASICKRATDEEKRELFANSPNILKCWRQRWNVLSRRRPLAGNHEAALTRIWRARKKQQGLAVSWPSATRFERRLNRFGRRCHR